jgi:hypothetical protein
MNITKLTFIPSGWLEISYIQKIQLPDEVTPEVPAVFDDTGNLITPAVPGTTVHSGTRTTLLQCTYYDPTQLELIRADCATYGVTIEGDDAEAIANWIADYIPPESVPATVPQVV